jgi:5-methylcytosine-specific restriction endonuclease McrA
MSYAEAKAAKQKQTRDAHRRRTIENQALLRAYLREHPCTDCGEWDIVVLEFDHLRDKTANVSRLVHIAPWPRVLEEIAKCEVACANCHRRRTARRAGYHSWGAVDQEVFSDCAS